MNFFKSIIRSFIISYAAIYSAQIIVGGFFFGLESQKTFAFVVVAVALLNLFIIPILKILSMPSHGLMFIFVSFILTSVIFYILPMFINGFALLESDLAQLRIFGFVLPSKHLTVLEATVFSGLSVAIVYHFLEWLAEKK